jgi:hypothetical protein
MTSSASSIRPVNLLTAPKPQWLARPPYCGECEPDEGKSETKPRSVSTLADAKRCIDGPEHLHDNHVTRFPPQLTRASRAEPHAEFGQSDGTGVVSSFRRRRHANASTQRGHLSPKPRRPPRRSPTESPRSREAAFGQGVDAEPSGAKYHHDQREHPERHVQFVPRGQ